MNISLTRRDFTAGLGAIVVAFSLDHGAALAQQPQPPRLPGSLNTNRRLDSWLRINADGTATVFTGKVELGQGILTALHQIAAEELDLPLDRITMISGDTGRTPNEGQTAGSQSVENSGTALRMAGAEARAILLELAAKRFGVAADTLSVADGTISTSRWPQDRLRRARRRGRSQARGDRQGDAQARDRAPDRRQVDPAHRYSRQGHGRCRLRAGPAAARHGARPRGASAHLYGHARERRRGRRQGGARRDRRGARRLVPRRHRRARGAGDQGARRPAEGCQVEGRRRTAGSGAHLRAHQIAARQGLGDRREAGAGAGRRAHVRGGLHQAVPGARLDRSVRRGRGIQGRQAHGVDPFARRVPAARRAREGAQDAAGGRALHPRRELGLLRPQRRRRRCARRRRCSRARCPAGRCGCNGCATTSSPGSPSGPPW